MPPKEHPIHDRVSFAQIALYGFLAVAIPATMFIGLLFVFVDPLPGESTASRVALGAAFYFVAGALFAFLVPRRWPIAALAPAAAPIAMGGVGLLLTLWNSLTQGTLPGRWALSSLFIFLVPAALALAGGGVGRLLRRRYRGAAAE